MTNRIEAARKIDWTGDRGSLKVEAASLASQFLEEPGVGEKGRLTRRELGRLREQLAREEMVSPTLEAFAQTMKTVEEKKEAASVLGQLGGIGVLTSISLPASAQLLEAIQESIQQTTRARGTDLDLASFMGEKVAAFFRGKVSSKSNPRTAVETIGIIRNHAVIAAETVRQFLSEMQPLLGFFSLAELASVLGSAGVSLSTPGEPPFLSRIGRELVLAKEFIESAQQGIKTRRGYETSEATQNRIPFLHQAMATLAHEHLAKFGRSEVDVDQAAQQLIAGHFAHQVHWIDPPANLLNLCLEILEPSLEGVDTFSDPQALVARLLLAAQKARLVNPGEITREDYEMFGLDRALFTKHQQEAEDFTVHHIEDPLESIPHGSSVVTIRGHFGFFHNGYLALGTESRRALDRFFPSSGPWRTVFSVNRDCPVRKMLQSTQNAPPAFPLNVRAPTVEQGLLGTLDSSLIMTSIEPEAMVIPSNGNLEKVESEYRRQMTSTLLQFAQKLRQRRGVKMVSRACGFDRHSVAPTDLNPLVFALRGIDLRRLVKDPRMMENLRATFPTNDVLFLLLSGVMHVSASRVQHQAAQWWTTGRQKHLWEVRSMVPRSLVKRALELVGEKLKAAGVSLAVSEIPNL